MLSFIGVQSSAGFALAITSCFLVGGLCGLGSARLALAYACILAQGHSPTPAGLMRAGRYMLAHGHLCRCVRPSVARRLGIASALLMAGVALTLFLGYGLSVYFLALLCAATLLLTLAIIDASTGLLPDALTLPLLWAGLLMAWMGAETSLPDAVAGATLGYLVPWALFVVYKCTRQVNIMGHGDFKLLAALGAWMGWQTVAPILFLASVIALLVAMWHQKTLLPVGAYAFGPFLILSAVAVFVDQSALHLWFSLQG